MHGIYYLFYKRKLTIFIVIILNKNGLPRRSRERIATTQTQNKNTTKLHKVVRFYRYLLLDTIFT